MEISKVTQGGVPSFPGERSQQVSEVDKSTNGNQKKSEETIAQKHSSLTKEEVERTVAGLNEILSSTNSHLRFMYHEKLQQYYATIVDNATNQVVKEIPPRKLLDVVASIWEQIGIIVDRKV